MAEKVIIVVPVYNVKDYLKKCVYSILKQTYKDIDILLVNDGSTDGSGQLCDLLSKEDDRIRVIHKENGGLSSARNVGIENATGKYICFIDSDDVISTIFVEHLLSIVKQNDCDIAVGKFVQFTKDEPNFDITNKAKLEILSGKQSVDMLFGETYVNSTIACNKLYNTSLFDDLRFVDGKINEDEDIMYQLFYASSSVAFSDKVVYGYFKREGSITKKTFSYKNFDYLEISIKRYTFFKEIGEDRYYHLFLKNYCWSLLDFSKKARKILDDKTRSKALIKEFKQKSKILLHSPYISPLKRGALIAMRILPAVYFMLVKLNPKGGIKG